MTICHVRRPKEGRRGSDPLNNVWWITNTPEGCPKCQYPIARQYEPTRVDVWTVLKETASVKHHESSRELGRGAKELHATPSVRRRARRWSARMWTCRTSTGRNISVPGREEPISARWARWRPMRHAVSGAPGASGRSAMERKVGSSKGTGRRMRRSGRVEPGGARGRGGVGCVRQHDALEELAGPTAQGALSPWLGGATPPVRGEGRGDEVADTACTVAVSLDGVMAPMKTQGGKASLRLGAL